MTLNSSLMVSSISTGSLSGSAITFSTLMGSTISTATLFCSTISSNVGPLTITNDVTIMGCAQFQGCVSTISTNLTLDSNVWGKYLFVNKAETALTLSVNTLAPSGTFMVIKNVASTLGNDVTVNIIPYGDVPTYTISSFSTLQLMSMPDGWYSISS
jgi:hypothetical protein